MKPGSVFFLFLGCVALLGLGFVYVLFGVISPINASQRVGTASPVATEAPAQSSPTSTIVARTGSAKQRNFEMGVTFPQWSPGGYGSSDSEWQTELPQMQTQTAACWVEMPVLLFQASLASPVIGPGVSTPSLASFTSGIQYAHALCLHVFVTPLLQVKGAQSWAGSIRYTTYDQEQAWFQSYWQAFKPYVVAAGQANVEQFAIGTEEEWLQRNAPASLWNGLIASFRSVFAGTLTYDMNWTSLTVQPESWMRNPDLKMIGVSAYLPIEAAPERVSPARVSSLWASAVRKPLDGFARELGRPIFISEVGYRNSADALYQPWVTTSSAPADPAEQAAACAAVLKNVLPDRHILGVFFWGWDEAEGFNLKNSSAAQAIHTYYASLQL